MDKLVKHLTKFYKITRRQAQVLVHLMQGRTTKQTALKLGISIKTVEKHRAGLVSRLNAKTSSHAALMVTRKMYRHNIKHDVKGDPFECFGRVN